MSDAGEYKINFGRWAKQVSGGLAIKHMRFSDIEWIAKNCTAMDEAAAKCREYIAENPEKFQESRQAQRRKARGRRR